MLSSCFKNAKKSTEIILSQLVAKKVLFEEKSVEYSIDKVEIEEDAVSSAPETREPLSLQELELQASAMVRLVGNFGNVETRIKDINDGSRLFPTLGFRTPNSEHVNKDIQAIQEIAKSYSISLTHEYLHSKSGWRFYHYILYSYPHLPEHLTEFSRAVRRHRKTFYPKVKMKKDLSKLNAKFNKHYPLSLLAEELTDTQSDIAPAENKDLSLRIA